MRNKAESKAGLIARGAYAGLVHGLDWTVKGGTIEIHARDGYKPSAQAVAGWAEREGFDFQLITGAVLEVGIEEQYTITGTSDPSSFDR